MLIESTQEFQNTSATARMGSFSRLIQWFLAIVLIGVPSFTPKGCSASRYSTSAMYVKAVTRFQRTISAPNVMLGIYSRSSNVAAMSLWEQEKLDEAKESLAQTVLTLTLLDIGGGFVLPVVEEIVSHIKKESNFAPTRQAFSDYKRILNDEILKPAEKVDKNIIKRAKTAVEKALKIDVEKFPVLSKVRKAFSRASKWLKGASWLDVLGPLSDSLTVGINIWGLKIAIEDENAPGVAAASLSIAAGLVGLTTFVAAVVTGSAVLGPIGAIIGVVLGLAATLVELIGGHSGYDAAAVEAYRNRLRELRNLRDACRARIDQKMEFLDKVESPYTDVYVNNQAASMRRVDWHSLVMVDGSDSPHPQHTKAFTLYATSLHQRKYVDTSDPPDEIAKGEFLIMGNQRSIISPIMPTAKSSTGWGKVAGYVGFDFYGKFKEGTAYKGVHVFIDSDFIDEEQLNDLYINTEYNIPHSNEKHDVISIGDYKKIYRNKNPGPAVIIDTGGGNDVLNINGMIGEFQSDSVDILSIDLGDGHNVLSFQGISKDRNDIKGIFFEAKTGALKYYHGTNRNTHLLGSVRNVELVNGSPFDDHVILYPNFPGEGYNIPYFNRFIVVQQRGRNTYEINCADLSELAKEHTAKIHPVLDTKHDQEHVPRFQIIDKSDQKPELNLKMPSSSGITANDVVLFKKKLIVFDTTGQKPHPLFRVVLETESTIDLYINNANPRPIIPGYVSPVLISGEMKFHERQRGDIWFKEGEKSDLVVLKWDVDAMGQPDGMSRVDMVGGTNYVLISEKDLIQPLGIDGASILLSVKRAPMPLPSDPLYEKCRFPIDINIHKPGFHAHYGYFWEICNAKKIINEYGDELVDVQSEIIDKSPYPHMNLYDRYIEVTRDTLQPSNDSIDDDSIFK